jgi:hypothetical protein
LGQIAQLIVNILVGLNLAGQVQRSSSSGTSSLRLNHRFVVFIHEIQNNFDGIPSQKSSILFDNEGVQISCQLNLVNKLNFPFQVEVVRFLNFVGCLLHCDHGDSAGEQNLHHFQALSAFFIGHVMKESTGFWCLNVLLVEVKEEVHQNHESSVVKIFKN